MATRNNGGDWKEWSQHVLIEIQRLNDRQEKMSETLSENTKQLEIHIEGVRLAREQNQLMKEDLEEKVSEIKKDIEPLRDHVKFINTSISFWTKFVGIVIVVPGSLYYCLSIYMKLTGR